MPWGVEPICQLDHSEQLTRVMPVDEASHDESFLTFRTELIEALERRDTTFVFGHLADNVRKDAFPPSAMVPCGLVVIWTREAW